MKQTEKNKQASFWTQAWQEGRRGFHRQDFHPSLKLLEEKGIDLSDSRVLIPLCGKSKDLLWFFQRAKLTIGVELSPLAIEEFLAENKKLPPPLISDEDHFQVWSFKDSKNHELKIFCGNIFDFKLNNFDLIYDRAALVALDSKTRPHYMEHLLALLGQRAFFLLNTLEYRDESDQLGPPYNVPERETQEYFKTPHSLIVYKEETITFEREDFKKLNVNFGLSKYFLFSK